MWPRKKSSINTTNDGIRFCGGETCTLVLESERRDIPSPPFAAVIQKRLVRKNVCFIIERARSVQIAGVEMEIVLVLSSSGRLNYFRVVRTK